MFSKYNVISSTSSVLPSIYVFLRICRFFFFGVRQFNAYDTGCLHASRIRIALFIHFRVCTLYLQKNKKKCKLKVKPWSWITIKLILTKFREVLYYNKFGLAYYRASHRILGILSWMLIQLIIGISMVNFETLLKLTKLSVSFKEWGIISYWLAYVLLTRDLRF